MAADAASLPQSVDELDPFDNFAKYLPDIGRPLDVLFRRILNTNGDLRFRDVFSNRKAERMVKRCTFQCIKHGLAPCLTRVYSYGINI
eukprot:scaffold525_cov280-Pinguiococcus_pyrenoidosus.AAC.2